ncbi:hypothetical protein LMG28690_00915 [Paraburkholderia caffeinilytica]|nr:hypothetical protein LMG28690_00915 [Paraburkholderia caffeinilytica]
MGILYTDRGADSTDSHRELILLRGNQSDDSRTLFQGVVRGLRGGANIGRRCGRLTAA